MFAMIFFPLLVTVTIKDIFAARKVEMALKEEMFEEMLNTPPRVAECVADIPPDAGEVFETALRYARMTTADLTRWKKNIKYSALLPSLQFGYQRIVTDNVDVRVDDSVSVTSSGVNVGPSASGYNQKVDNRNNVEVKATWYLDELLFNRDDLAISSESRAQISARKELLGEITDNYFQLKQLVSIYVAKQKTSEKLKGNLRLEIGRLTGRLDAATGGWFSQRFKWKGVRCE